MFLTADAGYRVQGSDCVDKGLRGLDSLVVVGLRVLVRTQASALKVHDSWAPRGDEKLFCNLITNQGTEPSTPAETFSAFGLCFGLQL